MCDFAKYHRATGDLGRPCVDRDSAITAPLYSQAVDAAEAGVRHVGHGVAEPGTKVSPKLIQPTYRY